MESEKAVRKIYEIKHRDEKKPLILMSDSMENLVPYVKNVSENAEKLIKNYFPGALTLVLEKSERTPSYITKGLNTVGIRVPDNEVFKTICKGIKTHVLATTSANLSNEPAALTYDEAKIYIGDKVDLLIKDYGFCAKGKASTVAGVFEDGIKIFRQGDVKI